MSRKIVAARFVMLGIALAAVGAADSWPRSSRRPVQPLPRPTVEARAAALRPDATHGYSFAVFGDQRALMGGGWRRLLRSIDAQAARNERLLFMVDTGDFVEDGSYNDQFALVADLLGEVRRLPYVVGVGNHEVDGNRPGPARENLARFLSSLGTPIGPDRLYYAMTVGRVRFLFLDSNDLVYDGSGAEAGRVAARAAAQMEWLSRELRNPAFGADATTVVVMHHPLIQSSAKHRGQSRALWSYTWKGRRLPDLLADGGVDLVLSGHTHTYERFRMAREDGRGFVLLNLSGTPEPSFLWFGAGARRARNIQGSEKPWLYDRGWRGLEEWEITQEDVMDENESNQYGLFTVDADGGISLEMRFLDRPAPEPPVRLVWGVPASLRLEGHE